MSHGDLPELRPGQHLGPYLLEAEVGEGGMGVVYRAIRDADGQVVALKVMRAELSSDETFRKRFLHEARAASELTHPHLLPIIEGGEADGYPFLAVEYVDGPSLQEVIRDRGPLEPRSVVRLVAQIGGALDALHAADLVHRDVKPANILMRQDHNAVLTDFGLAKGPAYTVLTRAGEVMGTLDYVAPELIRGQPATAASDIYALGCVAYESVTGVPPFSEATNAFQLATAHLDEAPPDPASRRSLLGPSFSTALIVALAKDPTDRPTTGVAYANLMKAGSH